MEWISGPVHFASPPYTSPGALKKAHDLTEVDQVWGQYPIYRSALHRDPEIKAKSTKTPHDFDRVALYDALQTVFAMFAVV